MACPDWPPPLPSLPLYPPCMKNSSPKGPPPVVQKNSSHQAWWDDYLGETLKRASGVKTVKKSGLYELTSRQRRELLPIKIPTKQDKLIWSIPLPAGSYPANGLPIWERLYLDHPLPMLRAPPDALVFARQRIGKKLWKNGKGQEFILYDPQGYEVQFSYENVHDPHLTNYYQGKEIRGFLLSVGDANADGWGICTLRRFNQYRKYLRRVHISMVHKEIENQDILQDEMHRIKIYRQITKETMEQKERKAMTDEVGAAIREALSQQRTNRLKRLMQNIRNKDRRVRKLYRKRAKEQDQRVKKGQKLQSEQELKKKISNEINRRKKIATLRRWHESEERRLKFFKKTAEEKARQKAEKVRLRWQNKIDNMRKMFASEDKHLELQQEVKRKNVEIRKNCSENIKQKQWEQFQELRKGGLVKKAQEKKRREDKKMADAIMSAWLNVLQTEFDHEAEVYRVKKSLNSTMAELLSQDTEGPDRYSIITIARNRIQHEQSIPVEVSFAIDAILESSIELWASKRVKCLVETVLKELAQHVEKRLEELKEKSKNAGAVVFNRNYKSTEPKGVVLKLDEEDDPAKKTWGGREPTNSSRITLAETEINRTGNSEEKGSDGIRGSSASAAEIPQAAKGVIVSYVHFGPTETFEYQSEESQVTLKPVRDRPKTPMPPQRILCDAVFSEERLKDVLPTISYSVTLKEKKKFRKACKNAAEHLFKRAIAVTDRACEPASRIRTINKLVRIGDAERTTVVRTLCSLLTNKPEKAMLESEEFDWVSRTLAKDAVNEVLRPPELLKVQKDGVARTKIMFYKPRSNKVIGKEKFSS